MYYTQECDPYCSQLPYKETKKLRKKSFKFVRDSISGLVLPSIGDPVLPTLTSLSCHICKRRHQPH
jgi:hypothetical protein